MSDFDKEAERERLREKYERDQAKREATEQMSELLLKGATMTNAHCDTCGDPIFRYDGEEFCPTCQEVVDADANGDADSSGSAESPDPDVESAPDRTESTADPQAAEADSTASTPEAGTDDPSRTGSTADETGDATADPGTPKVSSGTGEAPPTRSTGTGGVRQSAEEAATAAGSPVGGPDAGEEDGFDSNGPLADARASLVRTLHRQARQAEACEDPRRAKDHLAAAREAAETLAALY